MVHHEATFRCMALVAASLLLVIIDAVDINDPFIILAGMALNLDNSRVRAGLNSRLAVSPTEQALLVGRCIKA